MEPRSLTSLAKVSFLSLKKPFRVSPTLSLSRPEMLPRQANKFCSVVFILKVTADQYTKWSEYNKQIGGEDALSTHQVREIYNFCLSFWKWCENNDRVLYSNAKRLESYDPHLMKCPLF